jgi:phosphinothricin acetyltransferase
VEIRAASPDDLPRLLEIYNHYMMTTHITFDVDAFSMAERRVWFDDFAADGPHRLLVAESKGRVLGYASSGMFRKKPAYARSVETSIYLDVEARGSGVGGQLYASLLSELETHECVHRAYAGVTLPNDASVVLHDRLGFKRVATFNEVGFKFDRYWDVAWFERVL